jgi:hypothetical protein
MTVEHLLQCAHEVIMNDISLENLEYKLRCFFSEKLGYSENK